MPDKSTGRLRKTSIKSNTDNNKFNWLNIFRFGESYSSLLLGIIVVIITTILLVILVKDRNITQKDVSSTNTEREKIVLENADLSVTPLVTNEISSNQEVNYKITT